MGRITGEETDLFQAGASVMHKPSGLGVYAMGQWENSGGSQASGLGMSSVSLDGATLSLPVFPTPAAVNIDLSYGGGAAPFVTQSNPDTDAWYIKPFWRKTWTPAGATTLFGEYGQYNDQYAAGTNLCSLGRFRGQPRRFLRRHRAGPCQSRPGRLERYVHSRGHFQGRLCDQL